MRYSGMCLLLGLLVSSCGTSKEAGRPNIVFIMADDLGYQVLSSYGSKFNQTPNIDRLANKGMLFRNAMVTNSVCAPSRAVILTGKYSHLNGVKENNDVFDGSQITFPKLLQKNGYKTALVGKWHLKSIPTGFDYWKILAGLGYYYNPDFVEMGGDTVRDKGYSTNLITDYSLDWLKNQKHKKPFSLMIHYKAPHRNWAPDSSYLRMYDNEEIPLPKTFYDSYKTRSDAAREAKIRIADNLFLGYDLKLYQEKNSNQLHNPPNTPSTSWYNRMNKEQRKAWDEVYQPKSNAFYKANLEDKNLAEWKYERFIKDYLRCVAALDDNIGRILDYLDQSGLAENTIVIFTSDQGFFLGEHGWFNKRFMYEETLHMPLLVRYPGHIKGGTETSKFVLNLDFAPTLLDYAEVEIPNEMQGHSLRPLLEGQQVEEWRNAMYYHYYDYPQAQSVRRHYGIRTSRYKLIHFYRINSWELYDLQKDPYELHNVYHEQKYQDVKKDLKKELKKLRKKYKDTTGKFSFSGPVAGRDMRL